MRIRVRGLDGKANEEKLKKLFEPFGPVLDASVSAGGKIAFVDVAGMKKAEKAVEELHGHRLDDGVRITLVVKGRVSDRPSPPPREPRNLFKQRSPSPLPLRNPGVLGRFFKVDAWTNQPSSMVKRQRGGTQSFYGSSSPGGGGGASEEDLKALSPELRQALEQRKVYPFFTKKYIFSNHRQCVFTLDNIEWCCSEQYYMYWKAKSFPGNENAEWQIVNSRDPKEMKQIGSRLKNFDPELWDEKCREIMMRGCRAKFEENQEFRAELFRTAGMVLAETNPTDFRWGVAVRTDDPNCRDYIKWRGSNWLGFILTQIREDFMADPYYKEEMREVRKKTRQRRWTHDIGLIPHPHPNAAAHAAAHSAANRAAIAAAAAATAAAENGSN